MSKLAEFPDGMYVDVGMWDGPDGEQWVLMRVCNSTDEDGGWVKVEYAFEDPRKKFWHPYFLVRKAEFPTVVNGQWSGHGSLSS